MRITAEIAASPAAIVNRVLAAGSLLIIALWILWALIPIPYVEDPRAARVLGLVVLTFLLMLLALVGVIGFILRIVSLEIAASLALQPVFIGISWMAADGLDRMAPLALGFLLLASLSYGSWQKFSQ